MKAGAFLYAPVNTGRPTGAISNRNGMGGSVEEEGMAQEIAGVDQIWEVGSFSSSDPTIPILLPRPNPPAQIKLDLCLL